MNFPSKFDVIEGREPISEDPNVLRVFFRDAGPLVISISDWIELNLKIGVTVPEADLEQIRHRARVVDALRLATRYLTGRVRTTEQVRQYLMRKQVEIDIIDEAVQRLEQLEIVNDELYAQLFVEQRGEQLGKRRLFAKLRSRGISHDVAREAIARHLPPEVEEGALVAAAKKFVRQKGVPKTSEERFKLMNHLMRKGFSNAQIRSVIDRLFRQD